MKNTYYFDHDYTAQHDEKIIELRASYGWEGYGIFFGLIEMLCQNNGKVYYNSSVLSFYLRVEETHLVEIIDKMIQIGLLEVDEQGYLMNKRVNAHIQKRQDISDKRAAARAGIKYNNNKGLSIDKHLSNKSHTIDNQLTDNCSTNDSIVKNKNLNQKKEVKSNEKDMSNIQDTEQSSDLQSNPNVDMDDVQNYQEQDLSNEKTTKSAYGKYNKNNNITIDKQLINNCQTNDNQLYNNCALEERRGEESKEEESIIEERIGKKRIVKERKGKERIQETLSFVQDSDESLDEYSNHVVVTVGDSRLRAEDNSSAVAKQQQMKLYELTETDEWKKNPDIIYRATCYCYLTVLSQYPEHKTIRNAKLNTWYEPMRLLAERDRRALEEIKAVWDWVRQDDFWSQNILSTSKFREKYYDLLVRWRNKRNQSKSVSYETIDFETLQKQQKPNDKDSKYGVFL